MKWKAPWVKRSDIAPRILGRQGRQCFYCSAPLHGDEYVLDHLEPESRRGSDRHHNRVAACWQCDREKAGRLPTAREIYRQRRILDKEQQG